MGPYDHPTPSNYRRFDPTHGPAGVYFFALDNNGTRKRTYRGYVVRVPAEKAGSKFTGSSCAVGKRNTRAEADALFRQYCPEWEGEIPYYENVSKRYANTKRP